MIGMSLRFSPPSPNERNIAHPPHLHRWNKKNKGFVYYVIYAFVNSIMCVPCLYGYAAVIFAHDVFQPHINALSKLVILSSVVHQICFSAFSTLPFAIGQVQDAGELRYVRRAASAFVLYYSACVSLCSPSSLTNSKPPLNDIGLIFQSAMSHSIATTIISDAGGHKYIDDDLVAEIVSTTVVMLGLSTAFLGAVLILAGKFRFANAVAFLPLPVVGGERTSIFFASHEI
jgi:SulP family sulfate permease